MAKRQKIKYGIDFQWSSNSWTHNIFRVFELLFGRKDGIRAESATWCSTENGNRVEHYEAYTIEAAIAYSETIIRSYFRLPKFKIVMLPQMVTTNGFVFPSFSSPYVFSIATDATSSGTSAGGVSSITWSHTCSGSNLLIVVANQGNLATGTNNISGNTYNSTAFTQVGTGYNGDTASLRVASFWWLLNPTTGANNVVTSSSPAGFISGASASYSGVLQTGQPDASNTGAYGSPTATLTLTVVAENCWVIGAGVGRTTGAAGANTTLRSGFDGTGTSGVYDSGGAVASGSRSLVTSWSGGVDGGNMIGASFAPATTVAVSVSDTVTVTESVTLGLVHKPSVSDTVTVTESVTLGLVSKPSVSDTVTVTESVSMSMITLLGVNVFEGVAVTEYVSLLITTLYLDVFDSVTIIESNQLTITPYYVSVFDTIAVEDITLLITILPISVYDPIAVSELLLFGIINIIDGGLVENITVSESVSVTLVSFLSIFDSASLSENISIGTISTETLSDTVTVLESVTMSLTITIAPVEVIIVSENVSPILFSIISIYDSTSLSESFSSESIIFGPQIPKYTPKGRVGQLTGYTVGGGL